MKYVSPTVISGEINLVMGMGEEAGAAQTPDYHHLLLLFTKCVMSFDYSRSSVSRHRRKHKSTRFKLSNETNLSTFNSIFKIGINVFIFLSFPEPFNVFSRFFFFVCCFFW